MSERTERPRNKNKSKSKNKKNPRGNDRFKDMYTDPRFLPIDSRTTVVDNRFASMLDHNFPMLQVAGGNISDDKTEHYMKSTLQQIYKFKKSGGQNAKKVDELRREASEIQEENDEDEDAEGDLSSDYDSDDSVEDVRRDYDLKSILKKEEDEDDEEEEDSFQEKQEYTFDDFLDKFRQKHQKEERGEVEFNLDEDADDENEVDFDEQPNAEGIVRLDGLPKEEQERLMQRDIWEQNLTSAPMIDDGDETNRFAIMNFDYTLVNSTDFFMLFSSMCPPMGSIRSVTIYLSEFGKKRLEEESKHGPRSIFNTEEEIEEMRRVKRRIKEHFAENKSSRLFTKRGRHKKSSIEDDEIYEESLQDMETESLNPTRVRQYEMERMRYYFAVVVCDSKATATKLYEELDGHEIEFTSIKLDLRFIEDDTSFENKQILNHCDQEPVDYEPKKGVYAKQIENTNTSLSWDADRPERKILKRNNFKDMEDIDKLKQFLASDSESDSESESDSSSSDESEEDDREVSRTFSKKNDDHGDSDSAFDRGKITTEKKKKKQVSKKQRLKQLKEKLQELKHKKERSKYRDLVTAAKAAEDEKQKTEQDMEVTFDADLKQIGQDLVKEHLEKEKYENETWWESLERKRKKKKKDLKKQKKEEFQRRQLESSDDEDDDNNDSDDENDGSVPFEDDDVDLADDEYFRSMLSQTGANPELVKREMKKKRAKEQQRQRKEEKRRAKLELMMMDYKEGDDETKGFDLTRQMQKERSRRKLDRDDAIRQDEDDSFAVDLKDDRFKKLLEDPEFNLDPTHSKFVKTKNTEVIMHERSKQREKMKYGSLQSKSMPNGGDNGNGSGSGISNGDGADEKKVDNLARSLKRKFAETNKVQEKHKKRKKSKNKMISQTNE